MKKLFFILLISTSFVAFSQKSDFWNHVQFGGGFTIAFGNQTTIGISPSAIYNFDNGFALGTGLGYLHQSVGSFSTNAYSTSLIGLYQTNFGFQLSTDFDYYFANQNDVNGNKISTSFPALHLGIAYNKGRFAVGIRYDILYDANKSIFASPISPVVRFYF